MISWCSVTSITIWLGRTPSPDMRLMSATRLRSVRCCGLMFTEMWKSGWLRSNSPMSAMMRRISQRVRVTMKPLSSAAGMKESGVSTPSRG